MDAYELIDLGQSMYANSLTAYAIFLSLVSGYLVVAYTIGAKLDRLALTLVNILYLITTINTIGVMLELNSKAHFFSEAAEKEIGIQVHTEMYPAVAIAGVDAIVIIASLYFMWVMRRRKVL